MKIRMIYKERSNIFRDCTNGEIYEVELREKDSRDTYGCLCLEDSYCLKDDIGEDVCAWLEDIEVSAEFI